jgi:hypothetical protein
MIPPCLDNSEEVGLSSEIRRVGHVVRGHMVKREVPRGNA